MWILGIELPLKTRIGPRLKIFHGQALVVNSATVIGADCHLKQCTTIGIGKDGTPTIGSNVNVGSNSVVIGNIKIGNNVTIGAGSVVTKDIADDCTVVGNPARVLE